MGCRDELCFVTGTPIRPDDEVAMFLTIKEMNTKFGSSDLPRTPIALPIRGTYNDYSSVEEVFGNSTDFVETYICDVTEFDDTSNSSLDRKLDRFIRAWSRKKLPGMENLFSFPYMHNGEYDLLVRMCHLSAYNEVVKVGRKSKLNDMHYRFSYVKETSTDEAFLIGSLIFDVYTGLKEIHDKGSQKEIRDFMEHFVEDFFEVDCSKIHDSVESFAEHLMFDTNYCHRNNVASITMNLVEQYTDYSKHDLVRALRRPNHDNRMTLPMTVPMNLIDSIDVLNKEYDNTEYAKAVFCKRVAEFSMVHDFMFGMMTLGKQINSCHSKDQHWDDSDANLLVEFSEFSASLAREKRDQLVE